MTSTLQSTSWGITRKISFRFFFIFFGLFIFPFPLNQFIPFELNPVPDLWELLVQLVGNGILGMEETLEMKYSGSGDKLFDWIQNLTILSLAIIGTVLWSILDRKRNNYEILDKWFMVFLTYYLAYYMFVYGIIKLFYLQFIPPNLEQLFRTFGQASPMNLMWTFMGFSKTYTMFAGFSETIAGVFLIFRRTRTLGGLIAFGVMLNVFMMNMSYDIPVKLFSFQLMLMGLYVAMQDGQRLLKIFILNEPTKPDSRAPLFPFRRGRIILAVFQVILIAFIVISQIEGSLAGRKSYGPDREKSPLFGVYNVKTYITNQDTLPPLTTDTTRWQKVLIDYPGFLTIIRMDGKFQRYQSKLDTIEHTYIWHTYQDTANKYEIFYERKENDLMLRGVLAGDTIQVELENYPLEKFGLLNRGFHWVNEYPYNR